MSKWVEFPGSTAEIAGIVVIVVATMIVAQRTPVLKKFV